MFKKKEEKEEDKELTTAEVLKEIIKNQKALGTRLEKIEQKPQEVQQPAQEPEPVKPKIKDEQPNFVVQDIPTQTQKVIVDMRDEKNPRAFDDHDAIAEILNKITKLEKALA